MEFCALKKKDYRQAIQYAIEGMHFDWYFDHPFPMALYGRYFWYLELGRATQVIAAYEGDNLAGVLLAELAGEPKKYQSFRRSAYVRLFDLLQRLFAGGVGVYDEANRAMFQDYCSKNVPDGEIIFLAANPDIGRKGIGSALLGELARREKGKKVYLYTDNACTYQFYESRGFARAGEKDIVLRLGKKTVDLKCLLYSRVL